MSDEYEQAPADTPAESNTGPLPADPEFKPPAFTRDRVEGERSARAEATKMNRAWRDESDTEQLAPMPDAPSLPTGEVDTAIAKLNALGDDHADLVTRWGSDMESNLAYAKEAFRDISTNRPDLISKFERAGLGDDVSVLEHLASYGRLNAGKTGDYTIARRNSNVTNSPMASSRPRASSAQEELHQIMSDHPPGSDGYKSPSVQRRVEALSRQIAGSGSAVGTGGRTA
jgi:hypothetical protein